MAKIPTSIWIPEILTENGRPGEVMNITSFARRPQVCIADHGYVTGTCVLADSQSGGHSVPNFPYFQGFSP